MSCFSLLILFVLMINNNVVTAQSPASVDSECDDLDFLGMLPMREIMSAVQNAIRNDDETQNLSAFIQTPEFRNIFQRFVQAISTRRLLEFLGGVGLNVGNVVEKLGQQLHTTSGTTDTESVGAPAPGVNNLLQHVVGLLPAQKILRCLNFRFNTDPVFKTVMDGLNSREFRNLVEHVRSSEQFTTLQSSLEDRGLQINGLINQGLNYLRVPPS